MSLSINQVFENYAENAKQDHNWASVTEALDKSITDIEHLLNISQMSEEQDIYNHLVVIEDFDAYYDGRYTSVIDTWVAEVWKTKSSHWQSIFARAWLEPTSEEEDQPHYFRPSRPMLSKDWSDKNGMKDTVIITVKSISFMNE
jgi:hypothetical protein